MLLAGATLRGADPPAAPQPLPVLQLNPQPSTLNLQPDAPAAPQLLPVLHLADGDFVSGELRDCDQPKILRWQTNAFTLPFDFLLRGVNAIHFPRSDQEPKPAGNYCFEMSGGDLLFGTLVGLSAGEAMLDVPRFGLVHVEPGHIRRILRWGEGADLVYLGPNGLAGWDEPPMKEAWRDEAGHLMTEQDSAFIHGNFGIPAQASIELAISWTKKPDFVLALGVNDNAKQIEQAFRFEVWDQSLVVFRESDTEVDVAAIQDAKDGAGRLELQAYLDQEQNRIIVFSAEGKQLADLRVSQNPSPACTGIRLLNKRGDIRLERLRISRWNGEPPREVQADKSRLHRSDGSIAYGEVQEFDAAANEFVVREDAGTTRIDAADVGSVIFSVPDEPRPRSIAAVFQDGVRLSGEIIKVKEGLLWLACPGVREPLALPVSQLRTLLVLDREKPTRSTAGRHGRLELEGIRLHGLLVDGREESPASCLVWHPRASATASPLRSGVHCRIVYRDPPPQPQRNTQTRGGREVMIRRAQRPQGLLGGLARAFSSGEPQPKTHPSRRSLHLRTGDSIPCEVKRIDEQGVTFQTPLSDATFVAHDKVKAVELAGDTGTIKVNKAKRGRLLTLPRMQKDNPPTHLICSTAGDYLRARLNEMDDKTLKLEVRLETKQIRRDHVARIIWLHDDELDSPQPPTAASQPTTKTRVQALRSDGIRLTFFPEQLSDVTLSGNSEVLGACRVDLKEVDQLLIGGAIEEGVAQLAYQRWKLQHAVEPRFVSATAGSGAGTPGTESALVGKPAPDFELELVGGGKFRLSEQQGSVVVLDFWATWCGPCLQAMPQVDRAVHEYQDQNVQLLAVNLLEGPEVIASTLERLNLKLPVALDRDGVVAEKYAASAIPQTVVIGSDGNVARVFVGGGPQYGEQLREALKTLVTGNDER